MRHILASIPACYRTTSVGEVGLLPYNRGTGIYSLTMILVAFSLRPTYSSSLRQNFVGKTTKVCITQCGDPSQLTNRTMWAGDNLDSVRDRVLSLILSIARLQETQVETGAKWSIASGTTAALGETFGRERV